MRHAYRLGVWISFDGCCRQLQRSGTDRNIDAAVIVILARWTIKRLVPRSPDFRATEY
jgi:hypothetical protein